jgi:hypothetical protein
MSAPIPAFVAGLRKGLELATVVAIVDGEPRVRLHGRDEPLVARSLVPIGAAELTREVAVDFIEGDPERPLILGLLHSSPPRAQASEPVELEFDGHHVVVHASERLSLVCGKASITLDASGRVVIKGAQILTRASGSNRIRGASIQLN